MRSPRLSPCLPCHAGPCRTLPCRATPCRACPAKPRRARPGHAPPCGLATSTSRRPGRGSSVATANRSETTANRSETTARAATTYPMEGVHSKW